MTKETSTKWIQGINITLIITIAGLIVYGVRKNDLTFDNQKQKQNVIQYYNDNHPISESEAYEFTKHTKDDGVHMTFDEKIKIIKFEERQNHIIDNQVKIGQDLDEIKTLIKNRY